LKRFDETLNLSCHRQRSKLPILKEACSQAYPESATCVQRFDDSLNSAIRMTYRISLRSSSLWEPRYPLLRVVYCFVNALVLFKKFNNTTKYSQVAKYLTKGNDNDPSAGSPTETLLRLLLPLGITIHKSSNSQMMSPTFTNSPHHSPEHPIGSSDGRCVQRAGT
jgi:hypothetical protein